MTMQESELRTVPVEDPERLYETWRAPTGWGGIFRPVNHKVYGRRFIATAFAFFLMGGVAALLIRMQLAVPENEFIDPDTYRQLFTMHGITMMFLFAVPMGEAMGMYLVPLMVGSRDMAFPRLSAMGYWVFLIGGLFLWGAWLFDLAPDTGWFNSMPLGSEEFSPTRRIDFYATIISFVELSALVAAVEVIVTVFKLRAPGMSLNRIPVFVWALLVTSFMILFAMPSVIVGSVLLALDRTVDTRFFVPELGGDPLLWQHLFWFFGHPEVYIILIPGLGIVSAIVTTFSRRPIFGYTAIVISMVAIGIASFGLWVHHMFTMGIPPMGSSFFTAASIMIAIPSGVQIFCWIATLWGSRPRLATPLLFVLGFIFIFVLGGVSGVMVASVPFDSQVHDTFFVVAHFHYVLIGGFVFPMMGGFVYWFPKVSGRLLSESLGKASFWLIFTGFNVTFFPMHILGFMGMPRRVYTYLDQLGWGDLNLVATIGAFVLAAGVLVFIVNVVMSWSSGEVAGDDPWGGDTLEWATTSPPQPYNFHRIPVVEGRHALWDRQAVDVQPVVAGLRDDVREGIATTLLDAHPQNAYVFPGPTVGPLLTAIAVSIGFIGFNFAVWLVPVAFFLTFLSLVFWFWPRRPWEER